MGAEASGCAWWAPLRCPHGRQPPVSPEGAADSTPSQLLWGAPRCSQMVPGAPRWSPRAPRWSPGAPRWSQVVPRCSQVVPSCSQVVPRWSQMDPRCSQVVTRCSQVLPSLHIHSSPPHLSHSGDLPPDRCWEREGQTEPIGVDKLLTPVHIKTLNRH